MVSQFLSEPELIERWRLNATHTREGARRWLKELRDTHRIRYTRHTHKRILYFLDSVEHLEQEGTVAARDDVQEIPAPRGRGRPKTVKP